jgi:hypothetical protein
MYVARTFGITSCVKIEKGSIIAFYERLEGKRQLEKSRHRWEDNVKVYF